MQDGKFPKKLYQPAVCQNDRSNRTEGQITGQRMQPPKEAIFFCRGAGHLAPALSATELNYELTSFKIQSHNPCNTT